MTNKKFTKEEVINIQNKIQIEKLQTQIEYWKKEAIEMTQKYKSQCSKMGGYKTKVAKEVRQREKDLKIIEERIDEKKKFLEENNYEDFKTKQDNIDKLKIEVEQRDRENRNSLKENFEKSKQNIIDELSKELIRWTEENDIDNQRSQGYVIGINKAKKIIKEKLILNMEHMLSIETENKLKEMEKQEND